ncbi:DUF2125 domain-containing protein [Roseovarius sp. SCSIO 43702]|uniref:DUF2125 domain-containing protein n=1 Tax=Roseovarius sp. SCSIO 43702 TaxID=2823043 RepID=UPI001C732656|nr:DUF2125 domain-containing protein [Roseovarius sp. SCSIO 43702]QYX57540.1 DUF2125 domain-containing protein [Roseovarius sp. SCSIO 43702]
MSALTRFGGVAATMGFVLTGTSAVADVTPQQVWEDWKGYMTAFGYTIEAEEATSGNGLTVTDIVMDVPMPEDEGSVTLKFPELTFAEAGNGTVTVTFPSPMPIMIEASDDEGMGSVTLDYITQGYSMIAAGDPGAITYTYEAESIVLELVEATSDGTEEEIGDARVEIRDVSGTAETMSGDLRKTVQAFESGPVTYALDFTDAEKGDRVQLSGETESLAVAANFAMPVDADLADMDAALEAGFALDSEYTFGPGNMNLDVDQASEGEAFQFKSTSSGGAFGVAMDAGNLSYELAYRDLTMDLASSDLPFPVSVASEEMGVDLAVPIAKGDAPQDFDLAVALRGFTMSEFIWGMFDPEAKLPRDPATIALDLSGKATLNADLMDEDAMESTNVPGEVNEVTLNALELSFAGAELTGTGALELDNSDMTTYEGMPKPVGTITLALTGGNTLLDKLVEMGLLPEEQAMSARMMLGVFAVPVGDDSLESKLEFTEDGQMLANGQRLK